ncbi:hypothetical protein [Denitrobaculum tricleocarpae]|uniref:Uncharacterized protein n=1 Tax=Denitrobaculum tricleocarpae TaxID=2591009 RepID=A0A545TUD2_9PROT|nr:hypothetical protein [Denitrobaculum tricleocarpae]TQV80827.1 hypothetical protein FKG95_11810 [Denitrobaculum tricleocarpae]
MCDYHATFPAALAIIPHYDEGPDKPHGAKRFFEFENPKDENANRLKRILLHLGYRDHGTEGEGN